MTTKYKGRNVYISGGSSGIGLAVGKLFSSLGANVFVFSVDDEQTREAALQELREEARSDAQQFTAIELDVIDRDEVQKRLTEAAASFGAPTVLINSAGIGGAVYFENLSYERFDRTIKISLYGARNTCAALLPFMKEAGGYIVNVASMSGLIGLVGYTAYSSAKFGTVGFTESLRSELKQHGIQVSALCPPQVATPLLAKTDLDKPPETKAINDKAGVLQPEEVARALLAGMEKNRAIIIPGRKARLFYLFHRLFPRLREKMTDRTIRKVRQELEVG